MTAKGKINASAVQTGDRIIVRVGRTFDSLTREYVDGMAFPSTTKTGEGVRVTTVTGKAKVNGRRGYMIQTGAGEFYAEPIQTMWLAPEDAPGVKRAHAEALVEDAEWHAAANALAVEHAHTAALEEDQERTVAALRAEFPTADADRKLEIQGRLAALGTVVYPEGTPEHTEYAAKLKAALAAPGAWDFLDDPAEAPECPGPEGDQGHAARVADAGWCAFCGTYANGEPTPGRQADASLAKAELDDYQAAVAELDEYQRARLAAGWTVAVTDSAQAERIVAALVGGGSAAVITGGADRPTEVRALSPAELEDPARVERVSESHTVQVRDPEARVVVGDVVRIHRGTALYEVIRVEEDLSRDATDPASVWEKTVMARLVAVDPENDRDPGWVSADLLHRVPPVARVRTVRVSEFQGLADDPVAVTGTGWDLKDGDLRQVATTEVSGTRLPHAALLPWPGGKWDRKVRPVGCLRIGDALVVDDRCYRVMWDQDFREPYLVPARWRDR